MAYSFPNTDDSITVHGSRERTDNRRDKVYCRDVSIRVRFHKDQWSEPGESHFRPVPLLDSAIKTALAKSSLCFTRDHAVTPVDATVQHRSYGIDRTDRGEEGYPLSAWITVRLHAERPSRIPTADEAEGIIRRYGDVEGEREAAVAAVAAFEAASATERRAEEANHVLAQTVAQVRTKARGIVRYEQRLAALRAEYAAECVVQAQAILDSDDPTEWTWAVDGGAPRPIDPRIVAAVKVRLIEAARRSDEGSRFPRSTEATIKVEEVA